MDSQLSAWSPRSSGAEPTHSSHHWTWWVSHMAPGYNSFTYSYQTNMQNQIYSQTNDDLLSNHVTINYPCEHSENQAGEKYAKVGLSVPQTTPLLKTWLTVLDHH